MLEPNVSQGSVKELDRKNNEDRIKDKILELGLMQKWQIEKRLIEEEGRRDMEMDDDDDDNNNGQNTERKVPSTLLITSSKDPLGPWLIKGNVEFGQQLHLRFSLKVVREKQQLLTPESLKWGWLMRFFLAYSFLSYLLRIIFENSILFSIFMSWILL